MTKLLWSPINPQTRCTQRKRPITQPLASLVRCKKNFWRSWYTPAATPQNCAPLKTLRSHNVETDPPHSRSWSPLGCDRGVGGRCGLFGRLDNLDSEGFNVSHRVNFPNTQRDFTALMNSVISYGHIFSTTTAFNSSVASYCALCIWWTNHS